VSKRLLITGLVCRRSLYVLRSEWHCVSVNELRELRRQMDLSQRDFAGLLDVPLNTFRMWDSGMRPVPAPMLLRARAAVEHHAQRSERLPLAQLAREFHVHVRTLQAAVRTGRLDAHFSVKSIFGRPRRLATRAAAEQFMATHYRRFSRQEVCLAPLPTVPNDYDRQLRALRRRLRLTQDGRPDASAPLARPSSTSGSRGSERPRRSFGNVSCGSSVAIPVGRNRAPLTHRRRLC
jgi:transcriptional regulator with XRE-family HTH domain